MEEAKAYKRDVEPANKNNNINPKHIRATPQAIVDIVRNRTLK